MSQLGRLGNQLFQIAAVRNRLPEHSLVLIGFDDSEKVVTGFKATFISRYKLPRGFSPERVSKILLFLARLRLIGLLRENVSEGRYSVQLQHGLLRPIITVHNSFFQHHTETNYTFPPFQVRDNLIQEAEAWLKENLHGNEFSDLVFVHVRRGDYLSWPSTTHPAALNLSYYKQQISKLKKDLDFPFFILVTDDYQYALENFDDIENLAISNNTLDIDFALMTLCGSGVLSASSFAWWGAWWSKTNANSNGVYLAPYFWAGHAKAEWLPEGFVSEWITYQEVPPQIE